MTFDDLLRHMNPCPMCLDISFTDSDGVEHVVFDLCEIHQHAAAEESWTCHAAERREIR